MTGACGATRVAGQADSAQHSRDDIHFEQAEPVHQQFRHYSTVHGKLVVLDRRHEDTPGHQPLHDLRAVSAQTSISIHALCGELMLAQGGGGHQAAGICQVDNDRAAAMLNELIVRSNADG